MTPTHRSPVVPALSPVAIRRMRALASEFGHGWARDDLGPTDAELASAYDPAASAAPGSADYARFDRATRAWWSRLRAADLAGDGERLAWAGIAPSLRHESGSGTVAWEIDPGTGAVIIAIRRPIGPVVGQGHGGSPVRAMVDVARVARGETWISGDPAHWTERPGEVRRDAAHCWACLRNACRALGLPIPAEDAWPREAPRKPLNQPGKPRRL